MKKNYFNPNKNWISEMKFQDVIYNSKKVALFLIAFFHFGINNEIIAQSGIYESYAILNSNGGGNVYYDLQATTANTDFQGTNLGVFKPGNTLVLNGAQNKVYKCNTDDITNGKLYYRIYKTTDIAPVFLDSNIGFSSNDSGAGPGCQNQTWQSNGANINVLSSLTSGNYYLEIYTTADFTYSGVPGFGTHFAGNGGNNYIAQFTIDNPPIALCKSYTAQLDASGNVTITASDIDGGSTDDIGIVSFSVSQTTFTCANLGTNNVTLTVTDSNGQTATCVAVVTVEDNQAPVPTLATLPTITGQCSATVTAPTASDVCSGSIIGTTANPLSYATQGTYNIVWTFDDGNGNTTTQNQTVIVDDTIAPIPTLTTLPTITGQCSATVTAPTAADVCSGSITGTTANPLSYATQGTYNIVWTFDDGNGNTITQNQTVIVDDTTAPVPTLATLPSITGQCSATVTAPTASDVCSGSITGTTANPLSYATQGTYNIVWTFDDGNGNTITQNQTVIVDDTTAPVPTLATLPTITGQCSATVTAPTASDVCSGSITGTTANPLSYATQGTYNIVWTFDDGNGNTITQNQTVIVDDTVAPVTPTLANVNVGQCNGTPTAPTTTDACAGTITGTTSTVFPITTQGTTVVTWTFNDGNGNSTTANQNVIVDDNVSPVPTLATLPTITGQCSATVTAPTATDVCSGSITGTTANPLSYATQGTYNIVWTFDDGNGNTITQNQTVIVDDTIAPVPTLTTLPTITGQCSATVTAPTASDVCSGSITGTTANPLSYATQGTYNIVWTFDDGNGNTTTQNQTVIVDDTIAPVPTLTTLPTITGQCSATVTAPTASDVCSGSITGTTANPLSYATQGTYNIVWTFDDGNGNTTTQNQTVIVDDTIAPVPTLATLPTITGQCSATVTAPTASDVCSGSITGTTANPLSYATQGTYNIVWTFDDGNGNTTTQNQTVIVDDTIAPVPTLATLPTITGQCSATVTAPTASDVCSGSITGTTANPLSYATQGTYNIVWTFDDGNGNTITQNQTVIVDDTVAPVTPTLANVNVGQCNGTPTAPTTTDACAGTITGTTSTIFPITTQGTTVVTWTFNDGNGNSTTANQNVIVDDTVAPVTPTLANVNVGQCSGTPTAPTTTDTCAGTITGTTSTIFPITTQGTTVVTWTFNDGNGNSTTANQNVILDDTTKPTLTAIANRNENIVSACSFTIPDYTGLTTAADNCTAAGSMIKTQLPVSGTVISGHNTTQLITITANDSNGNTESTTFTITLKDITAPVAICKNFTLVLAANGTGTLLPANINNGSTDNCGIATMTLSKTNFTCTDANGTPQSVRLTVTDAAGNSSYCDATVTVQSTLAITATSNSVVCAGTTLNLFGNVVSGAFGTPTYSWTGPLGFNSTLQNPSIANVSMGAAGTYTLTVTNGNGCTASQTTTVIVNPVPNVSVDPTFTSGFVKKATGQFVLYTYTITNIGSVPDVFDLSALWINDNPGIDVDMDIRFKVGSNFYSTPIASPSIAPGGTFTFQVELQVQGNAPRVLNHTQLTVTSRLCTISSISADMYTYEYNGNLPTASGAQLELSKTANTASAIVGVPFNYVITIVNNSSSTSATGVVISDQVPANLTITDNGGGVQSGQTITWNIGTLTKIGAGINTVQKTITVVPTCALVPTVTNTANVFSTPPDNGLGVKVSSITIPVTDNIAPTAICKPITVYLDATGVAIITESMINNGSTDNCSIQSIAISKSSFNCTNLGANNVTLTVTDVSGNSSTCTSIVTVVDNQVPVFTSCPSTPAALCADNATSYTKVGTSWNAIATDNCSFSLVYTLSGSTTGTGTSLNGVAFNVGNTTVTWTATDTAGNTSNCIFTVTINGLPVITTQPITQLDCEGLSVNFTAVASETGLTYTWQRKKPTDTGFITIPIEGNISYPSVGKIKIDNVGSAQSPSGTQYQVVITNSSGCSVTSTPATLLVNEVTGISPIATNVTQCYGTNYSYTVSTSAPSPGYVVSYQWKSSVVSGVWNNVVNGPHFSGATTATLNIINGTPSESAEYKVQVIFHSSGSDCNVTTTLNRKITFLPELTPPVATITQPDCITPTGTVVLSGLPASGTWTLTRSPGAVTTTGTGTSTTISGLAPGTYTYTVTYAVASVTCTSVPSANVVIQAATTAIWNGSAWTNGPPALNQALEFTGDYNSAGDLTACSCTVTAGDVTINSGDALTITNWVHVNGGSLTFEDSASLVQVNNVSNTNSGNIIYKRLTTRISNLDYTYWASPVAGFTLGGVSPLTSIDKYYSYDSSTENWKQESAATSMVSGIGYIIRGPQTYKFPNPPNLYEATFIGVPRNGHYEINGITANTSYLLGNPYPSALDANTFLDDNQNVLDGTLYFWTHNTPIAIGTPDSGSGVLAYSGDDYASYNRTGGVATAAAPSASTGGLNTNIPSGKIASGQGFFGSSKLAPTGTTIVYDNKMRVGVGGISGNNSQFYKTKDSKGKTATELEKHRIWLDLTNTKGAFKQTLIGYVANATNDYEGRFDGESYDGNNFFDFYSINSDKNLTIQGRALPFDENDEVSLGYRVDLEGTFTIKIGQTDGLLNNQQVFLEDKLTNTITNLKSGSYTFNTTAGTFDNRFVLRYKDKTLSVEEIEESEGIVVLYSNNYKTLIIRNNVKNATVNLVTLFNMSGQKIAYWDVKGREQALIQIPIKNLPSEIYIVKIKTIEGEFSKKIIIK